MTIRSRVWIVIGACLALWGTGALGAATMAYSKGDRVNVRSRAGYAGEIITQLQRGQAVRILATNSVVVSTPDEPPLWYKIALPEGTSLWVSADYVDAETRTVTRDVLNVRAGPSADHAAVARVRRGTVLSRIDEVRDGWLKIGAPEGAVGYVPAIWMTFDEPVPHDMAGSWGQPAGSAASASASASASDSIAAGESTPSVATNAAPAPGGGEGVQPAQGETSGEGETFSRRSPSRAERRRAAAAAGEEAPRRRVVTPMPLRPKAVIPKLVPIPVSTNSLGEGRKVRREGLVIRPTHIQAPTFAALKSRDRNRTINFLMTSLPDGISWDAYRGKVVVVTGREYLDRRPIWKNVPLLDVEAIEAAR